MAVYLWLSKLSIHNANAMSSPCTVGFPAMTAWLGGVHALERRLQTAGFPKTKFAGTAVFSHAFDVRLYKGPKDFRYSVIGTANPLKKSNKTGEYERPPFIEEARCHLVVSLLVKAQGIDGRQEDEAKEKIMSLLWRMKFAGGDIENIGKVDFAHIDEASDSDERRLLRRLMPSYALVERRDLMTEGDAPEGDALDRLMDMLAVEYELPAEESTPTWQGHRRTDGWIVPIAVGFKNISGALPAAHQRDPGCEHHFAEPVVTLGEFRMPIHFHALDELLWEYHTDLEQGLYVCRNQGKQEHQ